MKAFLFCILSALLVTGCNESFSPNGTYERRLVVYSVFSANTDTQYIRITSTVDPETYNPNVSLPSTVITGATVVVTSDTLSYTFHDTIITVQTSAGMQQIRTYVHYQLPVKTDHSYRLAVQAAGYPEVNTTFAGIGNGYLLQVNTDPFLNSLAKDDISFDMYLGKNVGSYLLLFNLDYELLRNGNWIRKTFEVPTAYTANGKYFPSVTPAAGTDAIRKTFSLQTYKQAIDEIRSNPLDTVRFVQAVFKLYQFDNALYTYFSVANNYPGGATLRLDEPDYSNVSGGYGVVGVTNMYTRQFAVLPYP
ncbi:MAG: DUF4249 family protein [Bacteroidota bacterium]